MFIEIIKSDFSIEYKNIKPALKDVLDTYPEIKQNGMFKQRAGFPVAEQLQIALYLLGWHVRVHPHGYVMGIKSLIVNPLITNDYMETLKLLSMYAGTKNWILVKIDGEIKEIKFADLRKEKEQDSPQEEERRVYHIPEAEDKPLTPKEKFCAQYSDTIELMAEENPERLKEILDEKFPDEKEEVKEEVKPEKKTRGRRPKKK